MRFQESLCASNLEGTVKYSAVVTQNVNNWYDRSHSINTPTSITQIELQEKDEIFLYNGSARVDAGEKVRLYFNKKNSIDSKTREVCAMQILTADKVGIKTTYAPAEMFR